MERVTVGFKAFDVHELLLQFLATEKGLYEKKELFPQLEDTAGLPNDSLIKSNLYLVACGSALNARLQGIPWKILLVGCANPMFWVITKKKFKGLEDLAGCRICSYPAASPPAKLLKIGFKEVGIDPDSQVVILSGHDDATRIGLLRSCQVDAAVVSSAVSHRRLEQLGFNMLACLGDYVRIPTTGLAVHDEMVRNHPDQVRVMVGIFQGALKQARESPETTIRVISDLQYDSDDAKETYNRVLSHFTRDGRCDFASLEKAVNLFSRELGIGETPKAEEIYDFSYLT